MSLTPEQERRVADWWRAHNMRETCELCDHTGDFAFSLLTYLEDLDMFDYVQTHLLRTCQHCAFISFFDAELMGLVEPSTDTATYIVRESE